MGSPAYTTTQDLTGGDTARFPGEPRPCPTHWCSSHCEVTQHETSTRVALLACMLLDFALGHTERRHTRPPSRVVAGLGVPTFGAVRHHQVMGQLRSARPLWRGRSSLPWVLVLTPRQSKWVDRPQVSNEGP